MLNLVFWDVDHGHSTYVKTPYKHFMFDLGMGSYSSGREFSPLKHLKYSYGVSQLDCVVVTHPHSDHLYDIQNFDLLNPVVFSRPNHLTAQEVKDGNSSSDALYVNKYLELNNRYSGAVYNDPCDSANNGGVDFKFFMPKTCARSNLNNHSLVTIITYGAVKILLPGDNEPPSWNELLLNPEFVKALKGVNILLAPHHGRESGYSPELFNHITPLITIVSDGAETDTSAVSRYSAKSTGWNVTKKDSTIENRKCLTTRSDGVISVEVDITALGKTTLAIRTS